MAMIVQHNLTAMNSNRQLGVITSGQAKSSEKLSSGYKINRAGDDAAGLKISEKMRSQVRGLQRASTNAQDGVSLIQTAEGALNEAHAILQRMSELTVQGSNDTNQDIDRDAINQELAELTKEIDRIASTTQFNKQQLLDGSFVEKRLHVGANTNQNIGISIEAMNATAIGLNDAITVSITGSRITRYSVNGTSYSTKAGAVSNAKTAALSNANVAGVASRMLTVTSGGNNYYSVGGKRYQVANTTSAAAASAAAKALYDHDVASVTDPIDAMKVTEAVSHKAATTANVTAPTVSCYEKAQATLSKIHAAINNISTQRSALGALQNRLEHTIANLDNVAENTQAAESRIRDTDMASEMVEYSKNQILAQAGQAMLAQANQATQGVLSLLQ
jgi:flagellin